MMTNLALELQIRFLLEMRTEPYLVYGEGASQRKIGNGAKNTSGATSTGGWQAGVVRGLLR